MSKDFVREAFSDLYYTLKQHDMLMCECKREEGFKCAFCVARDIFSDVKEDKYFVGYGTWKRPEIKCLNTNEVFKNARQAGLEYNIPPANILKCCRGETLSAGKIGEHKLVWIFVKPPRYD